MQKLQVITSINTQCVVFFLYIHLILILISIYFESSSHWKRNLKFPLAIACNAYDENKQNRIEFIQQNERVQTI